MKVNLINLNILNIPPIHVFDLQIVSFPFLSKYVFVLFEFWIIFFFEKKNYFSIDMYDIRLKHNIANRIVQMNFEFAI